MERKTVRISVQVKSGAARFRVGVRAPSISEALALAGNGYPRGEVGVVFPAELRGCLDGKPAAEATERTLAMAA